MSTYPLDLPVIASAETVSLLTYNDTSGPDGQPGEPFQIVHVVMPPFADYVLVPARFLYQGAVGFVFDILDDKSSVEQLLAHWNRAQILFQVEPITDTIKEVADETVVATHDRAHYKQATWPFLVPAERVEQWTQGISETILQRCQKEADVTEQTTIIRLFSY